MDSQTSDNSKLHDAVIVIQRIYRGYIRRLKTVLDLIQDNPNEYSKLLHLYNIFGESLNSNDMKAMKGKIYEIFFSHKSKLFKHVDMIGYDIVCLGIKIEHKFQQKLLLTDVGRDLKTNITFMCKNSRESREMNISRENTAHIYILTQRDAIGYVRGNYVLKNLHGTGDKKAIIPNQYVNLIWKLDNNITISNGVFNLSNIITEIFKCICNSIWKNEDWKEDWKEDLKVCLYNIADNL